MIPIANPIITDKEKEKVLEVMDTGMLACGEYVSDFEENFASYIGCEYGVATTSGTTALDVAVKAAGIKEGDRVLTTPFTFIASSNSLLFSGARPVFADIDPETYNIDPGEIRKKLEEYPDIKALLLVHLYGLSCDLEPIMELVDEYDLILIEDCAQAHGAEYRGQRVGSYGHLSVFSFYPTKNMTTGEGGMVLTDNSKMAAEARKLINHGQTERYYHETLGYNYRMTNIAAAIGQIQLEKLDEFNKTRQENADFLNKELADFDFIKTPVAPAGFSHVYHQYTVRVEDRDSFADYLDNNGIGYGIYYSLPVYKQPYYQQLGYQKLKLPVTEKAAREVISLPVHPALSDKDLREIVQVTRDYR